MLNASAVSSLVSVVQIEIFGRYESHLTYLLSVRNTYKDWISISLPCEKCMKTAKEKDGKIGTCTHQGVYFIKRHSA